MPVRSIALEGHYGIHDRPPLYLNIKHLPDSASRFARRALILAHQIYRVNRLSRPHLAKRHYDPVPGLQAELPTLRPACKGILDHLLMIRVAEIEREERFFKFTQMKRRLREELLGKHVYLGSEHIPKCHAVLGFGVSEYLKDRVLCVGLDGGQVILGQGRPGSGKSQSALVFAEGIMRKEEILNSLGSVPRTTIAFHTDPEGGKLPQLLAAVFENEIKEDSDLLWERFATIPKPIGKLRLVMPWFLFAEYKDMLAKYIEAGLDVRVLRVPLKQIGMAALEILLNLDKDDAQYVQFLLDEVQDLGDQVSLDVLRKRVETTKELSTSQKCKALRRLRILEAICEPPADFAGKIEEPSQGPSRIPEDPQGDIWRLVEPGVTTIFMLSGQRIGRNALPIAAMLMSTLMQPSKRHGPMQRVFIFDEINNFDGESIAWGPIVRLARQIRHAGSILMILGQDLLKVPPAMFGLATMYWMFEPGNPTTFDHMKHHAPGFSDVSFSEVQDMPKGRALVVVHDSIAYYRPPPPPKPYKEPRYNIVGELIEEEEEEIEQPPLQIIPKFFGKGARYVQFRPPAAQHGGHTKTTF